MENIKPSGGVFKQLLVIILIGFSVYLAEGVRGVGLFLNLEAVVLVFGGTFFLTWTAYPLKEIFRPAGPEVLLHAAGCAIAMGALTTVLGTILMLASIDDISQVPRRLALALSGLFFGLLLSEVVLAPQAARLTAAGNPENKPNAQPGAGKRVLLSLFALGVAVFNIMLVLFALASSVAPLPRL